MPVNPTYPGVYIEEVPSGVRTIIGVATSITAFIGRALRGPVNEPTTINSYGDFEHVFGGLWKDSPLTYAVQQYFANGGSDALIARVVHCDDSDPAKNAVRARKTMDTLDLVAANEGAWGNRVRVVIDWKTGDAPDPDPFNLVIYEHEKAGDTAGVLKSERMRNVSVNPGAQRNVNKVLQQESDLVRSNNVPSGRPASGETWLAGGCDGDVASFAEYRGDRDARTGLYALEKADTFNLLCIPPRRRDRSIVEEAGADAFISDALAYCRDRRAVLVVDPPFSWDGPDDVITGLDNEIKPLLDPNAVLYYPRLKASDPLKDHALEEFAPCGAVAGVWARTDKARGVWKAPAGSEAALSGVAGLSRVLTDGENGELNPLGVNCLRVMPEGNVVWGARTLRGADRFASDWKYLPVRRTALFIEESLYRGTKWVVFEPNDEPVWAQIRLNVSAFMHNLFRQGAFQGTTPKDAYFVKCDKETTTQDDINKGIVNIWVGFAPLKLAEFVIIRIQQMAGQIRT